MAALTHERFFWGDWMKIAAMFLPQFHADPFNSEWWGDGFTEWTNVRKAQRIVDGQLQPREPLDGYFDLSDPAEIDRQAKLARDYGISVFSFYDYWYEGRRPLGKPLSLFLDHPEIDIELGLCWANHSWTRSWTNRTGALDILISQTYAEDRARRESHFAHLARAFLDHRYIRYHDKPVLQIYDSAAVPPDYLTAMRQFFWSKYSVEIHLDAYVTAWLPSWNHLESFDSATLFQPSAALFSPSNIFAPRKKELSLSTLLRGAPLIIRKAIYLLLDNLPDKITIFQYPDVIASVKVQFEQSVSSCPKFLNPMAFVDFDNTARYGKRAKIMLGYDSDKFHAHLQEMIALAELSNNMGYLFINSWNEWGEGAHLQPDKAMKFGRLLAVRKALESGK